MFAITRSNKAKTRFEPVQVFDIHPGILWRLYGDGRLGPLDLLANISPNGAPNTGIYYVRELPVLTVSGSSGQKVTMTVTAPTYRVATATTAL